MINNKSF